MSAIPRSIDRGPIEAKCWRAASQSWLQFRDQLIAAPLKRYGSVAHDRNASEIPQSIDRGPIEALSACVPPGQYPQFRDQLFAAPLKLDYFGCGHRGGLQFRDQLIAAPLKPVPD